MPSQCSISACVPREVVIPAAHALLGESGATVKSDRLPLTDGAVLQVHAAVAVPTVGTAPRPRLALLRSGWWAPPEAEVPNQIVVAMTATRTTDLLTPRLLRSTKRPTPGTVFVSRFSPPIGESPNTPPIRQTAYAPTRTDQQIQKPLNYSNVSHPLLLALTAPPASQAVDRSGRCSDGGATHRRADGPDRSLLERLPRVMDHDRPTSVRPLVSVPTQITP